MVHSLKDAVSFRYWWAMHRMGALDYEYGVLGLVVGLILGFIIGKVV